MKDELHILLVEDDPDTRANLCDILEMDGHRVSAAASASAAREIASGGSTDVVILDRRLPDGTAEELLPQLRRLAPQAAIIVVTGFADMDSTISALRHGAADYILKPINPDALRNSIDRIVQRRSIETELQREQKFADIILDTADAVILVLDLKGKIVRFNPYFERIAGWKLADVKANDWFDQCVPERDRDWLRDVFLETAADIETSGTVNPIMTKDGRERKIRWSNTTLKDEAGTTTSVLAVGVDITDVLAAQERALQSERLATIGQTMAALAHESRNALQRIQAGLELLRLEIEEGSEASRDLGTIQRATTDLNELLEEVRGFAGPIQLRVQQTSLPDIWRRAWGHLDKLRQNRKVELIESVAADDVSVLADVLRLQQVFFNLFENSMEACTDPVEITVTYSNYDEDSVEVIVRDNGPGLTAEQCEKIFLPFYTTKPTGTGLGMSIVQRIVEAHGGTISVGQSIPDRGSSGIDKIGATFVIRIPRDSRGRA